MGHFRQGARIGGGDLKRNGNYVAPLVVLDYRQVWEVDAHGVRMLLRRDHRWRIHAGGFGGGEEVGGMSLVNM